MNFEVGSFDFLLTKEMCAAGNLMANGVVSHCLLTITALFLYPLSQTQCISELRYIGGVTVGVEQNTVLLLISGFPVDQLGHVIYCGKDWLMRGVFEDVLDDFSEDFEVGLLVLVIRVEGLGGEGYEMVDDVHNLVSIVP